MAESPKKHRERKTGFSTYLHANKRVIVMEFFDFTRKTIDSWVEYIKAHDGKLRPPVRILYDMRVAGLPSRYMLDIIGPLMKELTIPEDTKSAYLFLKGPNMLFTRSLQRRMPRNAGDVMGFDDMDKAVQWLIADE